MEVSQAARAANGTLLKARQSPAQNNAIPNIRKSVRFLFIGSAGCDLSRYYLSSLRKQKKGKGS
ncbi:MAG: hypothetical protein LWX52_02785 [Deltaproteobacteria bacterium]|nr:hypothetical protein [Deltaproteobacteria bacterium]